MIDGRGAGGIFGYGALLLQTAKSTKNIFSIDIHRKRV